MSAARRRARRAGVATPPRADVLSPVDKAAQLMTVTVDGDQRYVWPVSTGMSDYDTPAGEFQAVPHGARPLLARVGRRADAAIRSSSPRKATPSTAAITSSISARPASHGCVRLAKANAAVLFALVKEQGLKTTKVVLTGDIPDAVVARRDPGAIYHEEDTSVAATRAHARAAGAEVYNEPRIITARAGFFPVRLVSAKPLR